MTKNSERVANINIRFWSDDVDFTSIFDENWSIIYKKGDYTTSKYGKKTQNISIRNYISSNSLEFNSENYQYIIINQMEIASTYLSIITNKNKVDAIIWISIFEEFDVQSLKNFIQNYDHVQKFIIEDYYSLNSDGIPTQYII